MSKFVRVKTAPTELKNGEYVISEPTFVPEITACARKKPRSKLMTINYLREIVATIGLKYAGEDFDAITDVNISRYVGTPVGTDVQVNEMVMKMFDKQYPEMLEKFVDYHLKQRPQGTKIIYFLGKPALATEFIKNGIDEVLEKDLESYLGNKSKKPVGKPAISNEEAAKLIAEQVTVV